MTLLMTRDELAASEPETASPEELVAERPTPSLKAGLDALEASFRTRAADLYLGRAALPREAPAGEGPSGTGARRRDDRPVEVNRPAPEAPARPIPGVRPTLPLRPAAGPAEDLAPAELAFAHPRQAPAAPPARPAEAAPAAAPVVAPAAAPLAAPLATPAGAPAPAPYARAPQHAPRADMKVLPPPLPADPLTPPAPRTDRAPVPQIGGGSGGRDGGSGGGGGGGGPLQRRQGDPDFRQVLTKGLSRCRRNLLTVAAFSFVVNMLVLGIPIYLFQISDRVMTSRSHETLIMLTAVVIGAMLAHVFIDMMRRHILMRVAVEAESKLGAPVLSAAAKAAQGGSTREFQVLTDMQQIRAFLTGPVVLAMLDAPVAPVYFLAVFLIHPHLGWIVAGSGGILMLFALLNQKLTAAAFSQASTYATRAGLQADAMARNAQVINAMGMIPEGVTMWGREAAASLKAQVIAQDRNIIVTGLSKFVRLSTQVCLLGWGAWLALDSQVTGGMLIAASIVGSRALAPIEGTIEGWRSFIHARVAYERVKQLLQTSPLNIDRLRLPRPRGLLEVERVLYVPPPNKRVILNGVSFTLEPGTSLAIVGASGSGKSTLARMLVGSVHPTAGNVRLDKMDLRNWDPRQFGESVGYLPQEVQLFPASIKANIARMREDASDQDIFEAAQMADIHEMISSFAQGYETVVGMDGSPLSGGQRQRIGLARAFFGRPRLVVLDEPNSNLDASGEQALAQALVQAKEQGITVVAITQRPALLKSVDRIMIIKDGAMQAHGKRDDILPVLLGAAGGGNGGGTGGGNGGGGGPPRPAKDDLSPA